FADDVHAAARDALARGAAVVADGFIVFGVVVVGVVLPGVRLGIEDLARLRLAEARALADLVGGDARLDKRRLHGVRAPLGERLIVRLASRRARVAVHYELRAFR